MAGRARPAERDARALTAKRLKQSQRFIIQTFQLFAASARCPFWVRQLSPRGLPAEASNATHKPRIPSHFPCAGANHVRENDLFFRFLEGRGPLWELRVPKPLSRVVCQNALQVLSQRPSRWRKDGRYGKKQ